MILLLFDTGIRLSELINLQMDDIDFLQSCILVKGKGNKVRIPVKVGHLSGQSGPLIKKVQGVARGWL